MEREIIVVSREAEIKVPQEFFKPSWHQEIVRYVIQRRTGILASRQVFLHRPNGREELKFSELAALLSGSRVFLKDRLDDYVNNGNGNENDKLNSEFGDSGGWEVPDWRIERAVEFLNSELNEDDGKIQSKLLCRIGEMQMSIAKLKRQLEVHGGQSEKTSCEFTGINSSVWLVFLFLVMFFLIVNIVLIGVFLNSMLLGVNQDESGAYDNAAGELITSEDMRKHCDIDEASFFDDSRLEEKIFEIISQYAKMTMVMRALRQLFFFL